MFLWLSHRTIANSADRKIVNVSNQVPLIEDSQIIVPIITAIEKSTKPVIRKPLLTRVTPCVHMTEDMTIKVPEQQVTLTMIFLKICLMFVQVLPRPKLLLRASNVVRCKVFL